jgi:hypothetical protein
MGPHFRRHPARTVLHRLAITLVSPRVPAGENSTRARYVRGGRLRLPPRGKTYQSTRATAITAAAIATTATVEAATITRPLYHLYLRAKRRPQPLNPKSARFHHRRCGIKSAYSSIPVVSLRRIAS